MPPVPAATALRTARGDRLVGPDNPGTPVTGGATGSTVLPGRRVPALLVAAAAAVGVWLTWRLFVGTSTGRLVDEAAFEGAAFGRNDLWRVAEPVLDVISVPFIAGVLVATVLLAVLRRRVLLAVQVAVLMGGANLSTQLLKVFVFDRPPVGVTDGLPNSLPSGHTAAAASVACALVLVVPRRARPAVAVLGVLYAAATGVSTLVGRWHRPSDAVAGVLVVLAWAGIASALGSRDGVVRATQPRRGVTVAAGLLIAAGLGSGLLAALALQRVVAAVPAGLDSRAEQLTAYGGGALAVVAVSCLAFGLLLLVRRSAEPRLT